MPKTQNKGALPKVDEDQALQQAVHFHKKGDLAKAKDLYRLILTQNPRHSDAMHRLGTIALQVEQYDKAADFIGQAVSIGPATAVMYINYGAALRNLEKFDQALAAYDEAISLEPDRADAHFNKGRAFQATEQFDEAITAYLKAIDLNPNDAQAFVNLGTAYAHKQRLDDGLYAFESALRLDPNIDEAYANIASVLVTKHLPELAIPLFDKALAINPNNLSTRFRKNMTLMQMGDFERGWEDFDVRIEKFPDESFRRPTPPAYWDGVFRDGERLLFWMEQGIGEQLLSLRTIPDLLKTGVQCVFECSERMLPVCERSFPDVKFIQNKDHFDFLKNTTEPIDYQDSAMSLLRAFTKTVDTIPDHGPYIKADAERRGYLRSKYEALAKGKRIIGISWRSTSQKTTQVKSADLLDWQPILETPDTFFVSLQYGDYDEELRNYSETQAKEIFVDDEVKPLESIDDALAQIAAMDLIISISNSNVHMAGAVGVPTWLLLPRNISVLWFWFMEGDTSPWYPSVRIFRQSMTPGFEKVWWPEVIEEAAAALQSWMATPLPPQADL